MFISIVEKCKLSLWVFETTDVKQFISWRKQATQQHAPIATLANFPTTHRVSVLRCDFSQRHAWFESDGGLSVCIWASTNRIIGIGRLTRGVGAAETLTLNLLAVGCSATAASLQLDDCFRFAIFSAMAFCWASNMAEWTASRRFCSCSCSGEILS